MNLARLADAVRDFEARGGITPGEVIVVGLHEPAPVVGALRIGSRDAQGRIVIDRRTDDGWDVLRCTPDESEAASWVFDQAGELVAARHWGDAEWTRLQANVERGAVLRTAVMLLWPQLDVRADRWDVVRELCALGITPEGRYWVEDVERTGTPDEEVVQLRRDGEAWVLGIEERGSFSPWARFSREHDAARELFREVVTAAAVSMGAGDRPAHVVPAFRDGVLAALDAARAEVADG